MLADLEHSQEELEDSQVPVGLEYNQVAAEAGQMGLAAVLGIEVGVLAPLMPYHHFSQEAQTVETFLQ